MAGVSFGTYELVRSGMLALEDAAGTGGGQGRGCLACEGTHSARVHSLSPSERPKPWVLPWRIAFPYSFYPYSFGRRGKRVARLSSEGWGGAKKAVLNARAGRW